MPFKRVVGAVRQITGVCVAGLLTMLAAGGTLAQTTTVAVDTLGPQIGEVAPSFSGVDQSGRTHTLSSVMGPAGAMLVFFRSADW